MTYFNEPDKVFHITTRVLHVKSSSPLSHRWIYIDLATNTHMEYELGYIAGALCGDGSLVWNKNAGNYGISLEVKDKDIANYFSECLKAVIEKSVKTMIRKRTYNSAPYLTFVVYFYGKKETKKLKDIYNVNFGTFEWLPPNEAYNNKAFRQGFLRAFFDCEGTVRIRFRKRTSTRFEKIRNIRTQSANKNGLFEIKKLLILENIPSIIYSSGKYHTLDIEGKQRLESFLKNIGFASKVKQEKLELAARFLTPEEKIKGYDAEEPLQESPDEIRH